MSRYIICTVGTSLLTNPERPWNPWKKETPLPSIDSLLAWLRSADLATASAETNTLRALEVTRSDEIALLHSDTPEGLRCAEALRGFYTEQGSPAQIEKIGALGYGAENFTTGLKGLVNVALGLVRVAQEQHRRPVFCATGGFKAEIAFLNLLGALLEVEVVYLHELHRKLVTLPRLPLAWDVAFVMRHKEFFTWIDEEPRESRAVESRLKAVPELRPLVEDDHRGHTLLSAAGDLLFKAAQTRQSMGPRGTWPSSDPRPPEEKNNVSSVEHHRPKGWESLVARLCAIDCISSVRFDNRARGAKVNTISTSKGIIGVCFGRPGDDLPLLLETTARGEEQCQLVVDYLTKVVK